MFQHDTRFDHSLQFSRFDEAHLLSTASPHPIELEGRTWLTAEHYLQCQLARSERHAAEIFDSKTARAAYDLGNLWYRRKRKGWKGMRRVLMSRALYTKVQMYTEVRAFLLDSAEQFIVETSLYDYYWGIGRDQRGENIMGKVWMDIREKLMQNEGGDGADG